ncbi:cytochrome b5-like heme/steroid binding domain-containing protein [Gorgonomyces haynaldii]|nr:cytochrome b5-like heme/steroid binding domain-containing protein [Gorgonomyces haynaldii]
MSQRISFTFSLFVLVCALISASYLSTETWDFGGQSRKLVKLYRTPSETVFTPRQLARYDGSDPNRPIYLAVKGVVYDVSAGRTYYGKGGSYNSFAGKDASRAYITGCFETHLTHDLRGLSDDELKALQTWIDFYEKSDKYFRVGTIKFDPIPEDAPIPPPCQQ